MYFMCIYFISQVMIKKFKDKIDELNFFTHIALWGMIIEFLSILTFIVGLILFPNSTFSPMYLLYTSSQNFTNVFGTNPTGVIAIITSFIAYTYLFFILSRTKFFSENTETYEKYSGIFWNFPLISFSAVFIFFILDIPSQDAKRILFNIFLMAVIIYNVIIVYKIPNILKENFYNYNAWKNSKFPKKEQFNYHFLESFKNFSFFDDLRSMPDIIFASTIMIAVLAFLFDCNLFLVITAELALLVTHFWLSQLLLIPRKKMTVELKETNSTHSNEKISDLFLITESSKGYFVFLNNDNKLIHVKYDSVYSMYSQDDDTRISYDDKESNIAKEL